MSPLSPHLVHWFISLSKHIVTYLLVCKFLLHSSFLHDGVVEITNEAVTVIFACTLMTITAQFHQHSLPQDICMSYK